MEEYGYQSTSATGAPGEPSQPPKSPKLYAFLYTIREWIANWKQPGSESKMVRDWMDRTNKEVYNPKHQRRMILFIVCIALFLDNMLYMVIVPIIPTYLREINAFPTENIYKTVTEIVNISQTTGTTEMTLAGTTLLGVSTVTSKVKPEEPNNTIVRSFQMLAGVYSKNEDINIGVLFACKAMFQLVVNPFTGTLMDRIGYDIPMMTGLTIIFLSTSLFAFGKSYGTLFVARSLQGVGSAFADTSGLAMIADRYTDDKARSAALGIALACISFGSLVAPPFGGVLYEYAGKAVPFIILALIALVDGILMLFVMKPVRKERRQLKKEDRMPEGTPIYKLILDPYVACCAGCLVMANVSLAFIEPTISLWMRDTMNAPEWQIGIIWLPAFLPHLAGVILTVKLAEHHPNYQWLMAGIGLAMEGVSCMIIPFCKSFAQLIVPLCILCFGIALVDTAILPLMGHLVDVRHVSVYGSVYAIADISYSFAYAFGPIIAGQIVNSIGFTALNAGIFVSNIIYAPLLVFLRNAYNYHRFVPVDEEDILEGELPGPQTYRTYTANSDDQELVIEFTEQTSFSQNGHPAFTRQDTESSSEEDEEEEEEEEEEEQEQEELNEKSVLQSSTSAGGLAGDKKPQPHHVNDIIQSSNQKNTAPIPKPRRASLPQIEMTERAAESDMPNASDAESDY